MKKMFLTAMAMVLSGGVFAGSIGSDGFVKVESIKGDSQYKNSSKFDNVQGIRGSWTNSDLPELRRLQPGMSKGQVRDALDSESVNYSSGFRGKQWQHAYNFQTGDALGTHNICIVKIEFDNGVAKQLQFKNVGLNKIGNTVDVCEPQKPQSKETIIIREVEQLGNYKIQG